MHAVAASAALALTLVSVACTVVPVRHGGAGVRRERAAALFMGVSTLDMVVPGLELAPPAGWGAALVGAALVLLVPVPRRPARADRLDAPDTARRIVIARHAGGLLVMAAMWWAMASPVEAPGTAADVTAGHAGHMSGLPFPWLIAAVATALAVVEVTASARARGRRRSIPATWRHPLMAVGMAAMALSMPLG